MASCQVLLQQQWKVLTAGASGRRPPLPSSTLPPFPALTVRSIYSLHKLQPLPSPKVLHSGLPLVVDFGQAFPHRFSKFRRQRGKRHSPHRLSASSSIEGENVGSVEVNNDNNAGPVIVEETGAVEMEGKDQAGPPPAASEMQETPENANKSAVQFLGGAVWKVLGKALSIPGSLLVRLHQVEVSATAPKTLL